MIKNVFVLKQAGLGARRLLHRMLTARAPGPRPASSAPGCSACPAAPLLALGGMAVTGLLLSPAGQFCFSLHSALPCPGPTLSTPPSV